MFRFASGRKKFFILACTVLGVLFSFVTQGHAGKIESFSADQVFMDASGKVMNKGKVYAAPQKFRMDGVSPRDEGNMTVIVRQDLKLHWMLNPGKKTYFERSLTDDELKGHSQKPYKESKTEDLGWENVNGYKCRKERITATIKVMGHTRTTDSIVWVSDQFDIPLRTQGSDGSVTELRNIETGKQTKDLFEVPSGYRKVAGMMEMMGSPSEAHEINKAKEKNQEKTEGVEIPEDVRKILPKGFKIPAGNR